MIMLGVLLLLMICNDYIYSNAIITITVDNASGNDSSNCLKANSIKPCKTLDFTLSKLIADHEYQNDTIIISIQNGTYDYSLNATESSAQFWHYSSISITGISSDLSTIHCNKPGAGFTFFNSTKVMIQDITFQFCGSSQNGTSFNSSTNTTSMVNAALYFALCKDVSIIRSVIEYSNNTGVVMYNTYKNLNVTNSKFLYNRNINSSIGGGGFYAEFTFCDPGMTNNCIQHSYSNVTYIFESSSFSSNAASDGLEKNNLFIRPNGTTNIALGRGGGLSLLFKGSVSNSSVIICNCNISFNKATWGAGLFVEFQDNSNKNTVLVKHTKIYNNTCDLAFYKNFGAGGGGVRIGFISFLPYSVQHNTIAFENCRFSHNDAYWGGGVSYYTFREKNTINATNKLSFTNCSWIENRAVLGSAIDLSVWHSMKSGVLSTVLFTECNFTGNKNEPKSNVSYYTESYLGTGAFYSDSIPVTFQNFVNFQNNVGSAMALSATGAVFMEGCESNFSSNRGWTGGAIALLDNAWLEIYDKTNFKFQNNSAILYGGAMSVAFSSRDLLSGKNCFLQYHDQFTDPQNWNTSFCFINNYAPSGHSIFATSLLSCVWGNALGKLIDGESIVPFNWNIIHFSDGHNISQEISSEIANITFIQKTIITVAPGQPVNLKKFLYFTDDTHKLVHDSVYLLADENCNVSVAHNLTADYTVTLLGPINSTCTLQIITDSPRIVSKNISVRLVPCPPGYFWSNSSVDKGKCICAYGRNQSWDGILYCDDNKFRAYIKKDYWAGYIKKYLYNGKCPKDYCGSSNTATLLPSSSSENLLNEQICGIRNRTGNLCGECLHGYCVAINRWNYKCTNANTTVHKYNWLILLATEYLPSTILLSSILLYDINLHSGPLGSIVMYFQVHNSLNMYSNGEIGSPKNSGSINKVINFLYNIWNLEYIGVWLNPYCLAKYFNTMQVLMISYLSGFYPFVIIFFISILFGTFKRFSFCNSCTKFCIRLRWRVSLNASIINGLSTFWTLAYTKLALVSCLILTIGYLEGPNDQSYPNKYVVFLQGNFSYFHMDHLPYAITASVVLIFFVILPSLVLLCYPLLPRVMAKIKNYINLDNIRFYAYISTKIEKPFIHFKPLLDSFQGVYKQGCEFFAGLLYWYRLSIFTSYAFASGFGLFFMNSIVSLVFVMLIAYFQPFTYARNNTIMLLITGNITLISLISLYHYHEKNISDLILWFQLLLVILPMIYFVGYTICGIKRKIQDYISCARPSGLYDEIQPLCSQEFHDSIMLQPMAQE